MEGRECYKMDDRQSSCHHEYSINTLVTLVHYPLYKDVSEQIRLYPLEEVLLWLPPNPDKPNRYPLLC